jgi:hypothetical protein
MTAAPLSTAQNSRVEALAEAIENLAIGVSATAMEKVGGQSNKQVRDFIASARVELRSKLREFLTPSFNIIDGGLGRYPEYVAKEDRVTCGSCGNDFRCGPSCEHWASAVRAKIGESVGHDGEDDEPPDEAA